MIRDRRQIIRRYVWVSALLLIVLAGIIQFGVMPHLHKQISFINTIYRGFLLVGIMIILGYFVTVLLENKIYKGIKYCLTHYKLMRTIRKSLKNAGYYIEQDFRGYKTAVIPRIQIRLNNDLLSGIIQIRNNVKLDNRLEDITLSSALGKYIVSQQYCSDDCNWYIYEFEDSCINRRYSFDSISELIKCAQSVEDFHFRIDKKTIIPLTSSLIVGSTGSGKTYATYYLVLSMLCWSKEPALYFCDPKNSSLLVLGNTLNPNNTAGTIEEIINLIDRFCQEMEKRKTLLQHKLNSKLDADYSDFDFSPCILIIDEFSSFISAINEEKKTIRDHVNKLIRDIVLQGRQLGFFIFIIMQKSDSSDIPTSIRSNLLFKTVLGTATRTTLLTAFEESADIPIRKYERGEGVYSLQGYTRQPTLISFPTLNFDILEGADSLL